MLIDTGCSTSELPQNAIQRLHEVLGRRTTTVPKPSRDPNRRETYHVSTWVLDNKSQVKFEFGGDPDEPPIIVYGPTETFVYPDEMLPGAGENNRLEGLIFPMVEDKKHGILGLNFFQSMFVAMSKAENAFALPKETNY
ncbi:hypothetical protein BD310DRAFT_730525 [Dichomitus squalens]|uniref:Peptidase A1 domain-containing protein n=1 Tax=Dichomitus squalens TaxID=114155 RepID=A0A4Q9PKW5_9APHY|nr:hypothetical protein BD310DRAFT_730525 [Dichomitus squalens]